MRRILFIFGCIFILLGAIGGYLYVEYRLSEVEVVAARPQDGIPNNTLITSNMVYMKKVHKSDVLEGAIRDKNKVINMVAVVPIGKGEQILDWKISGKSDNEKLGFRAKLNPDEVAVTLPVTLEAIGRDIRPGDRINIIQMKQVQEDRNFVVEREFLNKEVLEVSNSNADDLTEKKEEVGTNKIPRVLKIRILRSEEKEFALAKQQGNIAVSILGYQPEGGG